HSDLRAKEVGLIKTFLRIYSKEVDKFNKLHPFIKVAGICGQTEQAVKEAELAVKYNYDLGLVSLGGLPNKSEKELLSHIKQISEIIPIFGFYLQPAVGGRVLSYDFWKRFSEISNVMAIKVAPFNRYQTIDVVRAVCESSRSNEIALYTGNDDNIVSDLLTTFKFVVNGKQVEKNFSGGLLGQWAVWTKKSVELLKEIKKARESGHISDELLTLGSSLTDANNFSGCIQGLHEILYRQGLLEGTWCLNPNEILSEGQLEEINRVCEAYPHLIDDEFVNENMQYWKE